MRFESASGVGSGVWNQPRGRGRGCQLERAFWGRGGRRRQRRLVVRVVKTGWTHPRPPNPEAVGTGGVQCAVCHITCSVSHYNGSSLKNPDLDILVVDKKTSTVQLYSMSSAVALLEYSSGPAARLQVQGGCAVAWDAGYAAKCRRGAAEDFPFKHFDGLYQWQVAAAMRLKVQGQLQPRDHRPKPQSGPS
jgi:hypothetical protein